MIYEPALYATFDINETVVLEGTYLKDRNLKEVLEHVAKKYHTEHRWRGNKTVYPNPMEIFDFLEYGTPEGTFEDGDDSDTFVSENLMLMEKLPTILQVLADDNSLNYAKTVNAVIIHGISRYFASIGLDVARAFDRQKESIKKNPLASGSVVGGCGINIDETDGKTTTIGVPIQISGMVGKQCRKICFPKYKFYLVMCCYSLMTHPEFPGPRPAWEKTVEKFEEKVRDRIRYMEYVADMKNPPDSI